MHWRYVPFGARHELRLVTRGVYAQELAVAKAAASAAATAIEDLGPSRVRPKHDGSPVTAADLAANQAIVDLISRHFPQDALLSEESADGPQRLDRPRVWIVDPLDGTRDFIENTGQFSVHVALAVHGQPQVAVVIEPAAGRMSWAVREEGAFMSERGMPPLPLRVSSQANAAASRVGTSRFAITDSLRAFLAEPPALQKVSMGASTKLMALARGELEACVWLSGAEKEWDTCAPGLIVCEAGGRITDVLGDAFVYNQADVVHRSGILASNTLVHQDLLQRARRFFP